MMILYFLLYVGLVLVNSGFLMAMFVNGLGEDNSFDYEYNQERYRSNLGFCTFVSLIPIVWILTPFLTGFYEHGWMIRRPKPKGNYKPKE